MTTEITDSIEASEKPAGGRIYLFDNFKAILIFLVVFAHFLYDFQGDGVIRAVVSGIYFFHMPAFVFISGFLSRSERSRSPRGILKLFIIYLVFNGLMMIAFGHNEPDAVWPYLVMWYILALVVWRLAAGFLSKIRFILPILTALAIVAGIWNTITNDFGLTRIIVFAPFFMAGFMMDRETVEKCIVNRKAVSYLSGIVTAFIAAGIGVILYIFWDFTSSDLTMACYSEPFDIVGRAAIFVISALAIFAGLKLLPDRKIPLVSKIGKNTLGIYLCHRPVTVAFSYLCPELPAWLMIVVSFACSAAVVVFLGSDFIARFISWFFETAADIVTGSAGKSWKENAVKIILCVLAVAVVLLPLYTIVIKGNGFGTAA